MSDGEDTAELIAGPRMPAHFYVHVPFCASKCAYCDFASVPDPEPALVEAVMSRTRSDIARWETLGLPGVVETVYLGGGTPTYVAEESLAVLRFARKLLPLHAAAEVTVEANPDSLSAEAATEFAEAGATRLSVGVQSFDDRVLRLLGRRHDARRALLACEAVRRAGLDLAVDLMCGVPGQSLASWESTVERGVNAGARHVSVYPLSIEEGTPISAAIDAGLVPEPDPDLAADMMLLAERMLAEAGLPRYEVANYAAPGAESRHNLAYWTGRSYAGVGPAAHGMLDAATASSVGIVGKDVEGISRVRYANAADLTDWMFAGVQVELLTAEDAAREDVMLGLRLVRGVPCSQVADAGLTPVLATLERDALVESADGRWRTTQRGWLLGNEVFGRVWNQG